MALISIGKDGWRRIINAICKLEKNDEECWKFCDDLEEKARSDEDKRILNFLDILVEDDEQKEKYFKRDMTVYVDEVYKGHNDEQALKAMRGS